MPEPVRYRPDVETQRAQLTQARNAHQQRGFAAEIDLATLEVQDGLPGEEEKKDRQRAEYENLRDNSYKSARVCEDMLRKLPKPSPDPATRKK